MKIFIACIHRVQNITGENQEVDQRTCRAIGSFFGINHSEIFPPILLESPFHRRKNECYKLLSALE